MTNPQEQDTPPIPLGDDAWAVFDGPLHDVNPRTDGCLVHIISDEAILLVGFGRDRLVRHRQAANGRVVWLMRLPGAWAFNGRADGCTEFGSTSGMATSDRDIEALVAWVAGAPLDVLPDSPGGAS